MTATSTQQPACVDHLVVLAADLASGLDWSARTLGITPTAGGEHPLMGTHNRIFTVSSPAHPRHVAKSVSSAAPTPRASPMKCAPSSPATPAWPKTP